MEKRQLLKKIAKGASVALLAGAMVCGASLTNANAAKTSKAAAYEGQNIKKGKYNSHKLGAPKKDSRKGSKNVKSHKNSKNTKKNKNSKRSKASKSNKMNKSNKHARNTKKHTIRRNHEKRTVRRNKGNKKANTRRNRRNNVKRNRNVKKHVARRSHAKKSVRGRKGRRVVRKPYEPLNHKVYRHMNARNSKNAKSKRAFQKSAYYRNVWTKAEKINQKGIRKDEKAKKFDQRKGYKKHAKYLQGKINYLNGYVRHDQKMLSYAK